MAKLKNLDGLIRKDEKADFPPKSIRPKLLNLQF